MTPLIFLLVAGTVLAVAAKTPGRTPKRIKKPIHVDKIPSSQANPGIKVWGDGPDDEDATWRPIYLRRMGSWKDFHYGACFDQWARDMEDNVGGPNVNATIMKIVKFIDPGAGAIVNWINKHSCIIFKAKLRKWEDRTGGNGFVLDTKSAGGLVPPGFPANMPHLSGWTRAWYRIDEQSNRMRSPHMLTVFFPEENKIRDIAGADAIRAAIRLTSEGLGQISWKQIAGAAKDNKAKFWFTVNRDKARKYYK